MRGKALTAFCAVCGLSVTSAFADQKLWGNGEYVTEEDVQLCQGSNRHDLSEAEGSVMGSNHKAGSFAVADEFIVPERAGFELETMQWRVFLTQAGAGHEIGNVYVEIYDQPPDSGVTSIYGDDYTNRRASQDLSDVWRVDPDDPVCDYPIEDVAVDMSWVGDCIEEGEYWVRVSVEEDPEYGSPWAALVVPSENDDNSRRYRYDDDSWKENYDPETEKGWDFPFELWGRQCGEVLVTTSGTCPGPTLIEFSRLDAGETFAFLYAFQSGNVIIPPNRPCAGTQLGLGRSTEILTTLVADASGRAELTVLAPPPACGRVYVQAIGLSSCRVSNVVLIE